MVIVYNIQIVWEDWMKFKELKESEPLELIEGISHIHFPSHPMDNSDSDKVYEDRKVYMQLFTDGELEKESAINVTNIDGYKIGFSKIDIDTLKTKKVYLKKYNYAIVFLIAEEWRDIGNIHGWFDVVKDVLIYLENKEDKNALKTARNVITNIFKRNNSADYSSLFGMLTSRGSDVENFEIDKLNKDVYTVRKGR